MVLVAMLETLALSAGEQTGPTPSASFQLGVSDGTATIVHAGGDSFSAGEMLVVADDSEQSWASLPETDGAVAGGDSISLDVADDETVESVYVGGDGRGPVNRFSAQSAPRTSFDWQTLISTLERVFAMRPALVTHDEKKPDLISLAEERQDDLERFEPMATGTIGQRLTDATGLDIEREQSGSLGDDMQISTEIASETCDDVIFLRNPLAA